MPDSSIHMIQEWLSLDWVSQHLRGESAGGVEAPPLPIDQQVDSLLVTIRAITADKPTRNHTYYPLEELKGDGRTTGYVTFVRPVAVPVLLHHMTTPSLLMPHRAIPIGRVIRSRLVRDGDTAYVELTARITDEEAIEAIRRGLLYTVSIGHVPKRVTCSICGSEIEGEGCPQGHVPGKWYRPEGAKKDQQALAVMHGIQAVELSFVNVPSDHEARILSVQRDPARAEYFQVPRSGVGILEGVETIKVEDLLNRVVTEQLEPGAAVIAEAVSESVEPSPGGADSAEGEGDDRLLSGDELWFVDDDKLPEWAHEAKLTAAQRKRLPDSAFCGPDRSFPAHDKAHVLAGLRLLGRAKLSAAQKARVRACLLRRARRFGLPSGKDAPESASGADRTGILLILHPTELETYECVSVPKDYTVLSNLEAILEVGRSAQSLLSSSVSLSGEVGRSPDGVVFLPNSVEEYEALCATLIPAVTVSEESAESAAPELGSSGSVATEAVVAEPIGEDRAEQGETKVTETGESSMEHYRMELLRLLREQFAGVLSEEELGDVATAVVAVGARYGDLMGELDALKEQMEQLREALASARSEVSDKQRELDGLREEMAALRRQMLVQECVQLAIRAGHPLAARRSAEELVELFWSRPESYLSAFAEDMRLAIQDQQAVPTDVVVPAGVSSVDSTDQAEDAPAAGGSVDLPTSESAGSGGGEEDILRKLTSLLFPQVISSSVSKPEEDTEDVEIWRIYGSLGKPEA